PAALGAGDQRNLLAVEDAALGGVVPGVLALPALAVDDQRRPVQVDGPVERGRPGLRGGRGGAPGGAQDGRGGGAAGPCGGRWGRGGGQWGSPARRVRIPGLYRPRADPRREK